MIGTKRKRTPWLAIGAAGLSSLAIAGAALERTNRKQAPRPPDDAPQVVILGAGFAGLTVAKELSARAAGRLRVVLVDKHNYHLFTPMLYQAATLSVDPYDVAFPVRQFAGRHGVSFRRGNVTSIDFDKRCVQIDSGDVNYDYLVVAMGTTTNFFGNQAAQELALPLKWLEDGFAIRNQVVDRLEQAGASQDENERRELLTFVVVGGGATGVETAAALADLLRNVVPKDYPRLNLGQTRVLVIESEGKLLGHMGDRMAKITLNKLRAMGVEVWLNAKANDVSERQVTTNDGRTVAARTILWTTGVRVPDVVSNLDAEHGKGGSLAVDEYLQVCGKPSVYAIGDNSHFEDPKTHKPAPLLASAAVQEGRATAENIIRSLDGLPQAPFHYRDLGNVVSLGHRAGAAEVGGLVVGGLPGWLAWRLIHLAKITSFRNQVATLLDWSIGYLYDQDTVRLEVEPVRAGAHAGH